ncbi:MAG: dihydroneopterin aldolase [Bacteroidales bacterium]|nr:dihydroneopterin aldolase [Bacteroidales bacterium]
MKMDGKIELEGMRFHAFHGCLPEEQRSGNEFVVDFSCRCDIGKAVEKDDPSCTVDYSVVYDIVARQMEDRHNLLETLAAKILDAVLERFPTITEACVRVAKLNPPVAGEAALSRVSVSRKVSGRKPRG